MSKKFSSDARVILATSFPVFREIVLEYAGADAAKQLMFDQEQIDQIFMSPHHDFLKKDIAKIGIDILILKKKALDLRIRLLQRENMIKTTIEQLREKSYIDPKKISEIEKKLTVQYQRTEDSLQTLNTLLNSAIQKLAGELDNLMTKHDQEWRNHRQKFIEKMVNLLEENNLIFEYEKERLYNHQSIPEILKEYEG